MHFGRFPSLAPAALLAVAVACSSSDTTPATADAGSDAVSLPDAQPDAPDSALDAPSDGAPLDAEDAPVQDAMPDVLEDAPPTCTPADPTPEVGPGGFPLDGWTWVRQGVVLEDSTAGSYGGFIAPAAWVEGDTLHLWITRKQGTLHRIFHTTSSDGFTFSTPVETSGLEGENIIAYPSVLHDGTRFLMWYGSGTIDHAESVDGTTWTMVESMVLKTGEAGSFDAMSLLYPNVVATGSGFVMYYTGFNGQGFGIGRAESADGITWEREPAGPVLTKGTGFDNHAVAQPCAAVLGSRVLLWYGGYDTSVANPGPYRVGLAEAADGKVFERKGVSLDLEPSGKEAWSTRDPAVVRWKGGWWMAYSAMGDDTMYRIAVATSETCGE
jgi:hypothetical protein